ncbi:murein biosynthesis integral membrane protein MurJ [Microbacterium sp. gxy059]|uniref:murein biosynthesis integral membrane protein MurJ n=1 Tax=Microbacterium sp. gxy059 TaxID=2957199 RepID=UPI003D96AB79
MGLGRSSALIAAGTLTSRVTGLLRSMVLVSAMGATVMSADAFTIANQLPNYIFQVISTGVLTAVFVPLIVRWSREEDGGRRLISKLFTLATLILLVITAMSMLLAPLLVSAISSFRQPEQFELTVAFTLWCLPQIFFYGMFALVGETLNARRVFGPYAWAPIVNNVVSVAGFGAFIWLFGGGGHPVEEWTPAMIALMGGTATLGIVAQTVTLVVFWRRTGLRLRPDFRWRGMGLGQIRNLAGWSVGMLLVGLGVSVVQQNIITTASETGDASSTVWFNAWLVFMLPYSVIVMSIGTPYFTQLSEHAAAGRDDEVRGDIGRATRTLGLLVVLATAAITAAALPAARLVTNDVSEASAAAPVLIAFLAGLVPMAVLFVVQRTFYAYGDTRTPFLFTLFQAVLCAAGALVAWSLVGETHLTMAVAAAQSLSSVAQLVLASFLLRRRLGRLGMARSLAALVRFAIAAIPAGLAGWAVFAWMGGPESWMLTSKFAAAGGCLVIGSVCAVVYVALLALLRAPELKSVVGMVRGRLGR